MLLKSATIAIAMVLALAQNAAAGEQFPPLKGIHEGKELLFKKQCESIKCGLELVKGVVDFCVSGFEVFLTADPTKLISAGSEQFNPLKGGFGERINNFNLDSVRETTKPPNNYNYQQN
ncbi:Hypothetical protein NTJ_05951 [Nesidiocoris tenuis]|uniref:Uncharacterized protein n=1 Tax=Nesidiocoris tenuis TaxID=355587 RepID=A0ABN7ARZ7_9HEMI|nr:Hypothetical protein NTJ_05951 [Nesidiocoris tenuis]